MKIGIIGGGYVGLHTAIKLTETNSKWNITVFDIDQEKVNKFNNGLAPIDDYHMEKFMEKFPHKLKKIKYSAEKGDWSEFDIIFISLSTNPSSSNESILNTKLIFKMVRDIRNVSKKTSIVIRSTINIFDYEKIDEQAICYWPEFLSQGVETTSNLNQPVNIVSIPESDKVAAEMFEIIFKGKTLIHSNVKEAILIKLMHNTLDAYLISITNLFANISEENGMDFNLIGPAVETLLSTRTKVKKPGIGYGGSCYPKDSYSLINITESQQNKNLIQELDNFNYEQSFAFKRYESIIRDSKKITVLGSSFKGGTNDSTKTPTKSLRNWLFNNDIEYVIWEPNINEKWLIAGEEISVDIEKDILKSDLVIVASDWKEFNGLLSNFNGTIIDLKNVIDINSSSNIYKIGKGKKESKDE